MHAPADGSASGSALCRQGSKRVDHQLLEAGAESLYALAFHLGYLGWEFDVQEPAELREARPRWGPGRSPRPTLTPARRLPHGMGAPGPRGAAVVAFCRGAQPQARQPERQAAELEPVKKLAFEDVTALGVELQELDLELAGASSTAPTPTTSGRSTPTSRPRPPRTT